MGWFKKEEEKVVTEVEALEADAKRYIRTIWAEAKADGISEAEIIEQAVRQAFWCDWGKIRAIVMAELTRLKRQEMVIRKDIADALEAAAKDIPVSS